MEGLFEGNILSPEEAIELFNPENDTGNEDINVQKNEEKDIKIPTTEENLDLEAELVASIPEGVGSEGKEENSGNSEDPDLEEQQGSSPNNFYSSIATALLEDGVFTENPDIKIEDIKGAEEFKSFIEQMINSKLDETQKRIANALSNGVEPDEIRKYEGVIKYLDGIDESSIKEESDESETLRKQLIYQMYINMGVTPERAEKEVQKSLNAGTDIDDALDALNSNKEYFKNQYSNKIKEAETKSKEFIKEREKQAKQLEKSIMEDKNAFNIEVDTNTRKKIFEAISKPIFEDNDGNKLTAIQKYQAENPEEFLKNIGYMFVITDGFKNLKAITNNEVKKAVKKGVASLQHTLSGSNNVGGSLSLLGGNDTESSSKHWELDI